MNDFKKIIQSRNEGKTHREIEEELGVNERTIRNYLRSGRVPSLPTKARARSRIHSQQWHIQTARAMIQACPRIQFKAVYLRLKEAGYTGEATKQFFGALKALRKLLKGHPFFSSESICRGM